MDLLFQTLRLYLSPKDHIAIAAMDLLFRVSIEEKRKEVTPDTVFIRLELSRTLVIFLGASRKIFGASLAC